ncbi:MAG: hypothetical protein ACI964_001798 [Spirosomataceae bacterium]|jgi:hypothetical protein
MASNKIFDRFIKGYGGTFESYGFAISELNRRFERCPNQGHDSSTRDFIWSLFQELVLKAGQQAKTEYDLYKGQWIIYAKMLDYRRRMEKSKANEILQLQLKAYIQMSSLESRLSLKCVVISGRCCEFCDSLNEKEYNIAEVLDKQFLGSKNCTNDRGCNCSYSLIPERGLDGSFISIK